MRLVEILARELDEWPDTTVCYTQDRDGSCYPWTGTPIFYGLVGGWIGWQEACIDQSPIADGFELEVANDHATAIVTREMWEAERAKLEGKTEWDGEGLPPVGVVCEAHDYRKYRTVSIVAHDGEYALCRVGQGEYMAGNAGSFRSIRTQDKVAAEYREKAIREMMGNSSLRSRDGAYAVMAELYDAGYRKQEKEQ